MTEDIDFQNEMIGVLLRGDGTPGERKEYAMKHVLATFDNMLQIRGWNRHDLDQYMNGYSVTFKEYEIERAAIDEDFRMRITMARLTDGEIE